MRFDEQFSLRWRQVDLRRNQITLLNTKSGDVQHIEISPEVRKALMRLRAVAPTSELVCPDRESHRKWWDAARAEAKIDHFRWHDLRHTYATGLALNGVGINDIKETLRHGSVVVTERYAHLTKKHLATMAKRFSVPKSVTAVVEAAEASASVSQTIN